MSPRHSNIELAMLPIVVAVLAVVLAYEPVHALQSVLASPLAESSETPSSDESEEDVSSEQLEAIEAQGRVRSCVATPGAIIPPARSINLCASASSRTARPTATPLGFFLRC
jgi:hypothetical protein